MRSKDLKKVPWLIAILIVFSISIFYFPFSNKKIVGAEPSIEKNCYSSEEFNPLIVYYSRSGKTRMVANTLKDQLSCGVTEIKSTRDREGFFGIFTCVLDQLLDRDDQIESFKKDLKGYNPIIIASPIWIGKLSSPARTFIKQVKLQGKEVYMVITYNGRLNEEKENILKENITSKGIDLKRLYKIVTKEKTAEDIRKEISNQLAKRPVLMKKIIISKAMVTDKY